MSHTRLLLTADTHVPKRARELPEQLWRAVEAADVVVHETGPAAGRERRCQERYGGVDLLVFGHSHIPWDSTTDTGLRLLNPGSPTDRRRQPHCTYMTLTATDGRVEDLELHRLPPRVTGSRG